MGYEILSGEKAVAYAIEHAGIFAKDANVKWREIGDGNINYVYHMEDESGKSLIFKQALPYVRIVGDSWPLTIDRARIEAESMLKFAELSLDSTPKVYHHDDEMAVTIVEDLSYMRIMRAELMEQKRFPKFTKKLGYTLASMLFYTSDLYLDACVKKEQVKRFSNGELCKIVEDLVFTDPYFDAPSNDVNPEFLPYVRECWKDEVLRLEVAKLKDIYLTKAQCLIHGDLHTGSIFVSDSDMRNFDTEFAFYGPAGYDMGLIVANLLLNYASLEGRPELGEEKIASYRSYLLSAIEVLHQEFESCFNGFWDKDLKSEFKGIAGFREEYLKQFLSEAIGLGGCEVMRRTVGLARVADMESIEDLKMRAKAQRLAWETGSMMVKERSSLGNINMLTQRVSSLLSAELLKV